MTKQEKDTGQLRRELFKSKDFLQQRVLKEGKPLDSKKYTWCSETGTFSSLEPDLVLDFRGIDGLTFRTVSGCIFKTGAYCSFTAGDTCIFNTGKYCSFRTNKECIFNTQEGCTFNTYKNCTFITGEFCVFSVGGGSIFKVGEECVIIRRDIYEIIEIPAKPIKLNNGGVKGYENLTQKELTTLLRINLLSIEAWTIYEKSK